MHKLEIERSSEREFLFKTLLYVARNRIFFSQRVLQPASDGYWVVYDLHKKLPVTP